VRRAPLLLIDQEGAFPTDVQNPMATSLFLFGSVLIAAEGRLRPRKRNLKFLWRNPVKSLDQCDSKRAPAWSAARSCSPSESAGISGLTEGRSQVRRFENYEVVLDENGKPRLISEEEKTEISFAPMCNSQVSRNLLV
jgi:hypothetical protein